LGEYGEYAARYLGDYAFQFSLALVAATLATAIWIASRRKYLKSNDLKRSIEALRYEFSRAIEEVRATTARKAAGISDNLRSVSNQVDSRAADLNVRVTRLEEYADAIEAFMAGPQKQVLQQREQIDARLSKLEQRLTALTNQLSAVEQTIDGTGRHDYERNKSIDDIHHRLVNTQKRVEELFPRLELGEKARMDLGTVIGLFVKQLKRVEINSVETGVRLTELEGLRTKVTGLEQRLSSAVNRDDHGTGGNSIRNNNDFIDDEINNATENASAFERRPTSTEEAAEKASGQTNGQTSGQNGQVGSYSENDNTDQHPA
jgi:chromosome segregation ATPase